MTRRWRREYVDAGFATVTETGGRYVVVYLPNDESAAATVRVMNSLREATTLADQMAGKVASASGWWVMDQQ